MQLLPNADSLTAYLCEHEVVDYQRPLVQQQTKHLQGNVDTSLPERIQRAFLYVRDEIAHSWDIQSTRVTCKASDVLKFREGICYAKSHLLAALLRAQGIPAGFCYQRLMMGATPATGHCIHALNAVYLDTEKRWIRLDARGNKPGIQAQFSLTEEYLAFVVRPELAEIDYPTIYAVPHPQILAALKNNSDCLDLYQHSLPDVL